MLPKIKVCGVTREEDIDVLADAGVDCVGLNFVSHSPRCVSLADGVTLSRRARSRGLRTVAVLMNPEAELLNAVASTLGCDFIQLHGTESPEILAECLGVPVIKAISWSGRSEEASLAAAWKMSREERKHAASLAAFLVDAFAPIEGGGTGKKARWDLLWPRPDILADVPLILAGGITDKNVAEAIHQTRPDGIDTASGVEDSPGVKNAKKVAGFASSAQEAFDLW